MESRDQLNDLRAEPRPFRGLPVPLFERLTTPTSELGPGAEPWRAHRLGGAIASIRTEVSRILNTRLPPSAAVPPPGIASVIHYGIPDFSYVSPASVPQREALGQLLSRVIEAFEPRLRQVRVTLEPVVDNRRALAGKLEAILCLGLVSEPVCFPLAIHTLSGASAVGDVIEVEAA